MIWMTVDTVKGLSGIDQRSGLVLTQLLTRGWGLVLTQLLARGRGLVLTQLLARRRGLGFDQRIDTALHMDQGTSAVEEYVGSGSRILRWFKWSDWGSRWNIIYCLARSEW